MNGKPLSVFDVLTLEKIGDGEFTGTPDSRPYPTIYGGVILGQAMTAALHTVDDKAAHALQAVFLRAGDMQKPTRLVVEELQNGRSFARRGVRVYQDDTLILSAIVSTQADQPGPEHGIPMPAGLPRPADLPSETAPPHITSMPNAFDVRYIPAEAYDHAETAAQGFWVRSTEALPADPDIHQSFIAFLSDFSLFGPAIRRHGLSDKPLLATSLDHALWLHSPARADEWLLFIQESSQSGNSRGLTNGRFYTESGALVATAVQEGMMRVLSNDSLGSEARG